jgi:hypothetical protein
VTVEHRKRKYDIGGGVTITDDGHYLVAEHRKDDKCTSSIGIKRPPPVGPLPDELEVQYSEGGRYFYLPAFADTHGFWLSVQAWPTRAEMESQQQAGIMGKAGAEFTRTDTGEAYCRAVLHFAYWNVKAEKGTKKIARADEMAKDYLALAQGRDREQESRFNEVIAHTGRTLAWVMKQIGAWVPFPPEPPPVVL